MVDGLQLDNAAKLATLLAERVASMVLSADILLNINFPDLPLAEIKGVQITQLASKSHIDTVAEGNVETPILLASASKDG